MSDRRRYSRMNIDVMTLAERGPKDDFAKLALKLVGDLSGWTVLHEDVLVVTWVSRRTTAGGILLPETSVDEDRWQGILGLVVKLGENAFKLGPYGLPYQGPVPKIGDYITAAPVAFYPEVSINNISCKYINDKAIKAIVKNHEVAY